MRLVHASLVAAMLSVTACASAPPADTDPPIEGLAAAQAGVGTAAGPAQPEARRGGLFGLFAGPPAPEDQPPTPSGDDPETGTATETSTTETTEIAETGTTTPPPMLSTDTPPAKPGFLARMFGGGKSRGDKPETAGGGGLISAAHAATAPAETLLADPARPAPFGQVATACGLSERDLGRPVASAPPEGRAKYQLHDPLPETTGPRAQYITGFRDHCARQITGAMVMFGAPGLHEAERYDPQNTKPYSVTDTRYEALKARLCGVKRGVPCPADRTEKLRKSVSFIIVYPSFADTTEWFELLVADGRLEAAGMEAR